MCADVDVLGYHVMNDASFYLMVCIVLLLVMQFQRRAQDLKYLGDEFDKLRSTVRPEQAEPG